MKKTLLTLSIFLMFMSSNMFAAITASLSINTAVPSTAYPGYYDVQFLALSLNNTGCLGKFTVVLQRRQLYPNTETGWSNITGNPHFPVHTNPESTYSGLGTVQQIAGTKYEYQVIITFDPSTGGATCATDSNASKTSLGVIFSGAKPDFTLGTTGITFSNLDGPITLCQSNNLYYNPGLCELETKYYVGITACNRWWDVGDNVGAGQWYLTSAPNTNIPLSDILGNPLQGGVFPSGTLAGQDRYYRITVATGEPGWFTKGVLIRVDQGCRATVVDVKEFEGLPEETVNLYPNPANDNLTVNLSKDKLIKNVSFFDMNNNLVKEEQYKGTSNTTQVNISTLKKGLYFVVIKTTDDSLVKSKIVKE